MNNIILSKSFFAATVISCASILTGCGGGGIGDLFGSSDPPSLDVATQAETTPSTDGTRNFAFSWEANNLQSITTIEGFAKPTTDTSSSEGKFILFDSCGIDSACGKSWKKTAQCTLSTSGSLRCPNGYGASLDKGKTYTITLKVCADVLKTGSMTPQEVCSSKSTGTIAFQ